MEYIINLSSLNPPPHPQHSQAYQEALVRIKELDDKLKFASLNHIQSDMNFEYMNEKEIKEYKEKRNFIIDEEKRYQSALQNYNREYKGKIQIFNFLFKSLNENLALQLREKDKTINSNQSLSLISKNYYLIKMLDLKEIEAIHPTSSFDSLRALFLCENVIVIEEQDKEVLNENKAKEMFNSNEDEYILFLLHKNTLTQEYLQARKKLYKTLYDFKELQIKDLENSYQIYRDSLIINKEYPNDNIQEQLSNESLKPINNKEYHRNAIIQKNSTFKE